jgi:hypothetical protein
MIIAVDFDGTIVKSQWPNIGKPRFGALNCLRWLKSRGHKLILWTCRDHTGGDDLQQAMDWLSDKGIEFDYFNENDEAKRTLYRNDTRKIGADWYIDDKAGFIGWWSIPLIVWWLEFKRRW